MSTSIVGVAGRRVELEVVVRVGTVVALLSSAVMHSLLAAEDYGELTKAGTFFLALQLLETSLAMTVISAWSFSTAVAVAASSVANAGVWMLSRTTGTPWDADTFTLPGVGASGLAVCLLELTAAALVTTWALHARPARRSSRRRAGRKRARVRS